MLNLHKSKVIDTGLEHLKQFTNLRHLDLSYTRSRMGPRYICASGDRTPAPPRRPTGTHSARETDQRM